MPRSHVLGHVAAHREATDHRRLGHVERVEQGDGIVGELGDACRRRAGAAAEAALIGHDQPHVVGERILPGPHRVVERKAVEKHQRQPAAPGMHGESRVGQVDRMHAIVGQTSRLS